MPYSAKTPSAVSTVLMGPILRKVTPDSVSVFIVTKSSERLELRVYAPGYTDSGTYYPSQKIFKSGYVTPLRLGRDLYACLLTAHQLPSSTFILNEYLTYGYNIYWETSEKHFGSSDILNSTGSTSIISYSDIKSFTNSSSTSYPYEGNSYLVEVSASSSSTTSLQLPTFCLPPSDISKLRILHGSCRKPHGPSHDAMQGMNAVIGGAISDNTLIRPQMLFLTGDQIYADDVADAMLKMLMDTAHNFMDWDEDDNLPTGAAEATFRSDLEKDFADKYGKDGVSFSASPPWSPTGQLAAVNGLRPGLRTTFIKKCCQLSVEGTFEKNSCKSHLIKFREFVMMYLFVWSDVLWPAALPDFDDVLKKVVIYSTGVDTAVVTASTAYQKQITTVFPEGFVSERTDAGTIDNKAVSEYKNEIDRLLKFKDGLGDVRKMMANIPSYMVMDDHEITDDLFFNKDWTDYVIYASPPSTAPNLYGRQVLRNGLAAAAFFQIWGNTPEDFVGSSLGNSFLGWIGGLYSNPHVSNADWDNIYDALMPFDSSEALPGGYSGTYNMHTTAGTSVPPKIQFNFLYSYSGLNFEVIGLDTRRNRSFINGDKGRPGLINHTDIKRQLEFINYDYKALSIVISAAPVEGFNGAEAPIDAKIWDDLDADRERWGQGIGGMDLVKFDMYFALLNRSNNTTTHNHRVVFLTGDVHYSYAKDMILTNYNGGGFLRSNIADGAQLRAACLVASSFKNQLDTLSGTWGATKAPAILDTDNYTQYLWPNISGATLDVQPTYASGLVTISGERPSYIIRPETSLGSSPPVTSSYEFSKWVSMRIKQPSGSLPASSYLTWPSTSPGVAIATNIIAYFLGASAHDLFDNEATVGKNNFGLLFFNWTTGSRSVVQRMYARSGPWEVNAPTTSYPTEPTCDYYISLEL